MGCPLKTEHPQMHSEQPPNDWKTPAIFYRTTISRLMSSAPSRTILPGKPLLVLASGGCSTQQVVQRGHQSSESNPLCKHHLHQYEYTEVACQLRSTSTAGTCRKQQGLQGLASHCSDRLAQLFGVVTEIVAVPPLPTVAPLTGGLQGLASHRSDRLAQLFGVVTEIVAVPPLPTVAPLTGAHRGHLLEAGSAPC